MPRRQSRQLAQSGAPLDSESDADRMKEIKAYIHRTRIGDVVYALRRAGFQNISIVDVKGTLKALDSREEEYSIEIGNKIITEVKLELVCASPKVNEAVCIVRANARTGQPNAGWIYVSSVDATYEIDEGNSP